MSSTNTTTSVEAGGTTPGAYGLIGTILTLGLLILYVVSCVSAFVFYLRERRQDFRVFTHVMVPAIPVIILFFVFYAQVYPVPPYPFNLALPIVLIWIVLGIVYLIYLNRTNPTGLQRSKEVFYQDPEPEPENLRTHWNPTRKLRSTITTQGPGRSCDSGRDGSMMMSLL